MLSDQEKTSELVLPKSQPDPETPFPGPVVPRSEATGLQFTIDHGTYVWYLNSRTFPLSPVSMNLLPKYLLIPQAVNTCP